ncbi:MAG: (Fe-S)-binding protein [Methylacidiphilales bacterium]|nr:(Fe-S)-binding protein [Candidatus Methylacidiphilales bacterium]MDW8348674.1 (Fe-S)-binding protein [Verrucomicrobiae bacterium]
MIKATVFIPCFVDLFYPEVGVRTVQILERLGHQVDFREEAVCCGQPPFNSGLHEEARKIATRTLRALERSSVIIVPSASCAAMLKIFMPRLFEGYPEYDLAVEIRDNVYEISDYLVNHLGVVDLGARLKGRAVFHDGCHGLRELGLKRPPRELLRKVKELELVEASDAEMCCGFGGTFAVRFPELSTCMAEAKCATARDLEVDFIISCDSSCLMHLQSSLRYHRSSITTLHLVEVLASR